MFKHRWRRKCCVIALHFHGRIEPNIMNCPAKQVVLVYMANLVRMFNARTACHSCLPADLRRQVVVVPHSRAGFGKGHQNALRPTLSSCPDVHLTAHTLTARLHVPRASPFCDYTPGSLRPLGGRPPRRRSGNATSTIRFNSARARCRRGALSPTPSFIVKKVFHSVLYCNEI